MLRLGLAGTRAVDSARALQGLQRAPLPLTAGKTVSGKKGLAAAAESSSEYPSLRLLDLSLSLSLLHRAHTRTTS
jgi:hypothetical protein